VKQDFYEIDILQNKSISLMMEIEEPFHSIFLRVLPWSVP